jgi:hypothetical protein
LNGVDAEWWLNGEKLDQVTVEAIWRSFHLAEMHGTPAKVTF